MCAILIKFRHLTVLGIVPIVAADAVGGREIATVTKVLLHRSLRRAMLLLAHEGFVAENRQLAQLHWHSVGIRRRRRRLSFVLRVIHHLLPGVGS